MLVLVLVTPMTRDQSLSLREDIVCNDLNELSMPNWQSYDHERLGYVYEREWSHVSNLFRSHSPVAYSLDLLFKHRTFI